MIIVHQAAFKEMQKLAAENSQLPLCGLVGTVFTSDEFTLQGALENAGYAVEFSKGNALTKVTVWSSQPNPAVIDPATELPEERTLVAQGMSDTPKDAVYQAIYAAMREEVAAAATVAE